MSQGSELRRPSIGVAVFVLHHGLVLIGRRARSYGAGTLSIPCEDQKWGQCPEDAAMVGVRENTGLMVSVKKHHEVGSTNNYMPAEDKHYVTLFYAVHYSQEELPQISDPDKFTDMQWMGLHSLERLKLFAPLQTYFEIYGFNRLK